MLTMVGSTEVFAIHAVGFSVFYICSIFNLISTSKLKFEGITGTGTRSSSVVVFPATYLLIFIGCFISYNVHNEYCTKGAYTIFGALELAMIFTNIIFWFDYDGLQWKGYTLSIESIKAVDSTRTIALTILDHMKQK